ncbi:MAG: hypothetical protein WCB04_12240 [Mycobacteriales bacterium]
MRHELADAIAASLRGWDVPARVAESGPGWFDVRVQLDRRTEAVWDIGDQWGLGAQILRDGEVVDRVPVVPGSETGLMPMEYALMIARFGRVPAPPRSRYPVKTCARSYFTGTSNCS